ncbi:Usp domain-containing protein [Cephalotus follicularis]|uniref:Usp domain-containing protein n=1 Tax=Cephalotus follicularis TaxID=3775 RepID=A0A1Q3BE37_CEPFO|nr:Usp domain-containing protein [Cephalotus follicularis]
MEETKIEEQKKKVMVAIDESECSHYALQWALDNLHHTITDSELVILTVQPVADFAYLYASTFGVTPSDLIKSMQETQKKVAQGLLERAKAMCAEHGIVVEALTQAGEPKDIICDTVEKLKIQLLILGSHSRGAIQRAFVGSVSSYCVNNAKCAVLVVKKPA